MTLHGHPGDIREIAAQRPFAVPVSIIASGNLQICRSIRHNCYRAGIMKPLELLIGTVCSASRRPTVLAELASALA
jgi:hypothetical protein